MTWKSAKRGNKTRVPGIYSTLTGGISVRIRYSRAVQGASPGLGLVLSKVIRTFKRIPAELPRGASQAPFR
jgi:hypothetical protein